MKHALPKQRKLFPIHRRLLRKLANIRACYKRLLARTSQNQYPNACIIPSIRQRFAQLFHRLPVQRIQHLRPVKRNPGNSIFLFVNQILVSHLSSLPLSVSCSFFSLLPILLCVLCISALSSFVLPLSVPSVTLWQILPFKTFPPPVSLGLCNRKTRVPLFSRSTLPKPSSSTMAAPQISVP